MRGVERLVGGFRDRALPPAEWTHAAHLAVGTWFVLRHGVDGAVERLREGIRGLNDAHGTPNSDTRGHHETITRAYLLLIAERIGALGSGATPAACARAVLASPLAARDALLAFYSEDRLLSVAARRGWVGPDRRPLPAGAPLRLGRRGES